MPNSEDNVVTKTHTHAMSFWVKLKLGGSKGGVQHTHKARHYEKSAGNCTAGDSASQSNAGGGTSLAPREVQTIFRFGLPKASTHTVP
jgi:hypothetical protein